MFRVHLPYERANAKYMDDCIIIHKEGEQYETENYTSNI